MICSWLDQSQTPLRVGPNWIGMWPNMLNEVGSNLFGFTQSIENKWINEKKESQPWSDNFEIVWIKQ